MAVAQWPVVAASHAGSADPDDGAEDDEEVGAERGDPGECDEAFRHGSTFVRSGSGFKAPDSNRSAPCETCPHASKSCRHRNTGRSRRSMAAPSTSIA